MSLASARVMGMVGSSLAAAVAIIVIVFFPNGQPTSSVSLDLIYALVFGLPNLIGTIASLVAVEKISKVFEDRSMVDRYVLAFAFTFALSGTAAAFAVRNPEGLMSPVGYDLTLGQLRAAPATYAALFSIIAIQGILVLSCFLQISRRLGGSLFKAVGVFYLIASLSSVVVGTLLLDVVPFLLGAAYWRMPVTPGSLQKETWDDIPKVFQPYLSQLWFLDAGISRIRPVLGNITIMFYLLLYGWGFVMTQLFNPGNVSISMPPAQTEFEGLGDCCILIGFIIVSRLRYPSLSVEDAERHKTWQISWDSVSKATSIGTSFRVAANGNEYSSTVPKTYVKQLTELLKTKIGDRFSASYQS